MNTHLQRLKALNISKKAENIVAKRDVPTIEQGLAIPSLNKIIQRNLEDAIIWNPSILSRIYKIDETYVKAILRYVYPMDMHVAQHMDSADKLMKSSIVIDTFRLKNDRSYLTDISSMKIPKLEEKLVK